MLTLRISNSKLSAMGPHGIPLRWVGIEIPGKRICDGTYCEIPLEKLPKINAPENLNWISPLSPKIASEVEGFFPEPEVREANSINARNLILEAKRLELAIPSALTELMLSEELQKRLPSWTACTFGWPSEFSPSPFGKGFVLPFLSDQQDVVVWYLHFDRGGPPCVLASYPLEDQFGVHFLNRLGGQTEKLDRAAANSCIAALTFSEFLYRYWIENTLCFKLEFGLSLSSVEAAYIAQL